MTQNQLVRLEYRLLTDPYAYNIRSSGHGSRPRAYSDLKGSNHPVAAPQTRAETTYLDYKSNAKTSKAPGKKGDRSSSDPESREEEKPRDGGEGERGGTSACVDLVELRRSHWGCAKRRRCLGSTKGLSPSPAAQSYGDACRRHRGSPDPARCMWSSGPPDRRRLSHRRIQSRHDVWGPDSQPAPHVRVARTRSLPAAVMVGPVPPW
jgi:hypothetical protein